MPVRVRVCANSGLIESIEFYKSNAVPLVVAVVVVAIINILKCMRHRKQLILH